MGDVVNLRRARKAKLRRDEAQAATEARALHGRTKAERVVQEEASARLTHNLDQARREKRSAGGAVKVPTEKQSS